MTGTSHLTDALIAKGLELLKEIVRDVRLVTLLSNPAEPVILTGRVP